MVKLTVFWVHMLLSLLRIKRIQRTYEKFDRFDNLIIGPLILYTKYYKIIIWVFLGVKIKNELNWTKTNNIYLCLTDMS